MATIFFFLAGMTGLIATGVVLAYFRRRTHLTRHQHSLIIAIGMFLTLLISFFAPFMAPGSQISKNGVIFGIILAISTGLMSYIIVYIFLAIKGRDK
jgi:uncharacterized membrane protein (DUF485 family)